MMKDEPVETKSINEIFFFFFFQFSTIYKFDSVIEMTSTHIVVSDTSMTFLLACPLFNFIDKMYQL